jgi:hypothetical protein
MKKSTECLKKQHTRKWGVKERNKLTQQHLDRAKFWSVQNLDRAKFG